MAQELIDACGPSAGLRIGQLARSTSLNDVERSRLMAIADEIALRQGYSWYFQEDEGA